VELNDYYRLVRQQVDHETDLVNGRLSWLVGSETFLFIGYANVEIAIGRIRREVAALRTLVPIIGLLIATVILLAVHAATIVTHRLRREYERNAPECPDALGVRAHLPNLVGGRGAYRMSLVPVYALPFVFIATWSFLITIR
jgi:hypothetical protein